MLPVPGVEAALTQAGPGLVCAARNWLCPPCAPRSARPPGASSWTRWCRLIRATTPASWRTSTAASTTPTSWMSWVSSSGLGSAPSPSLSPQPSQAGLAAAPCGHLPSLWSLPIPVVTSHPRALPPRLQHSGQRAGQAEPSPHPALGIFNCGENNFIDQTETFSNRLISHNSQLGRLV